MSRKTDYLLCLLVIIHGHISSFMVIFKGANELKAVGTPNSRIRTSRASEKSFSTQDSQEWRRL